MDEQLLLESSYIFDGHHSIDLIRQSYIDIPRQSNDDQLITQDFIDILLDYLKKPLLNNILIELTSTVLPCIKYYPQEILTFIKNFKLNSNYILINSIILSNLTHEQQKSFIFNYGSFVSSALKEILPQILNKSKLFIFDHEIPIQFKNSLIINLLLSINLTEKLIFDFFPYLFSINFSLKNPKFDILIQKVINLNIAKILPQTNESNHELCEFIKNPDFQFVSKLNKEAFSIVESSILFTKSEEKCKITDISKETILPFIALILKFAQNFQPNFTFSTSNLSDLICEGIQFSENNDSPILSVSIDFILDNYFKFSISNIIPFDDFFRTLTQRLLKGEYLANKIILISVLFDLTNNSNCNNLSDKIKPIFNQYGIQIIKYIISNSNIFFNCEKLKKHKLNLELFESNSIIDLILNSIELCQTLYFIENFCNNFHKLEIQNSIEISNLLTSNLHKKINEQKWNDVLLICKFMKSIGFLQNLEEIKQLEIPDLIKQTFFEYNPNIDEKIDQILSHILNSPNPENNDKSFQLLFDKMIEDDELLEMYLSFLIYKSYCPRYFVNFFLKFFKIEVQKYSQKIFEVIKKIFYINKSNKTLMKRLDFSIYSLPISKFGSSIVSNLFDKIKEKKKNYQAFICLKNIANSFPLLFYNRHKEIFESVLPELNNFSLIFEDNFDELIKTSYSAFSFLLSTFQLPIMIDHFIFMLINDDITKFTDSQIACFISILNYFYNDQYLQLIIQSYFIKFKFFEFIEKILKRDEFNHIENNHFLRWFKETIFKFIKLTYDVYIKIDKNTAIQIDEAKKFENILSEYFDKILLTFSIRFFDKKFEIKGINSSLSQFISDVERTRDFWLIYDNEKRRNNFADANEISNFISNFENLEIDKNKSKIPKIPITYKIRTLRYLFKKPILFYSWFLNKQTSELVQPLYDEFIKISQEVNKIQSEKKEDPDDANSLTIEVSNYLYPLFNRHSLLAYFVDQIIDPSNDSELCKLLRLIFKNFVKKIEISLFIFGIISQKLTEIYNNDIICESPLSLVKMNNIIQLLNMFLKFEKCRLNFFNTCGYTLLDIILSPYWRDESSLLLKVANFLNEFKQIPIRCTHLIAFLVIKDNKSFPLALQLAKKIENQDIDNISSFIYSYLDNKLYNEITPELLDDIIEILPNIFIENVHTLIVLFDHILEVYLPVDLQNEKLIDIVSNIFNMIAPKCDQSISITSVIKESKITQKIRYTSPAFWDFFEKHSKTILSLIDSRPLLLDKFKFLLSYPELICFGTRSVYFRTKMRKKIKTDSLINLYVNRHNILFTSFDQFKSIDNDDILNKFNIVFENERGCDSEGLTREWFTLLSREIFNQNYALFVCSPNNQSYSPNSFSGINENHLEYFYFAGRFVARALIQGQCIDAHLTTSFLKQILHRKPKLEDLQVIDESLYSSLEYLTNNDVDSLEMVFAVNYDSFGEIKTYNLIENGENIKLTNINKETYIEKRLNYAFDVPIQEQLKAFSKGFDGLISHTEIRLFTPDELDLLICGIPIIDVNDFKENISFEHPYNSETPVVKMFFNVISKWDNSQLVKLLMFMTGSSRVPSNGFKEFCDMCGNPLLIGSGGEKSNLPQSKTCKNMLCIPQYESEDDLNEKLLYAINNSDSFEFA